MKTESVVVDGLELDQLLTDAREIVDGQRKVYDAIAASKRKLSDVRMTAGLAKANLELALSDELLEKPDEEAIVDAREAMIEAEEEVLRTESALAGLRTKLTDRTTDGQLATIEARLSAEITPLAQVAVGAWRAKYDSALAEIKGVLAQASALDRTVRSNLVRDALNLTAPPTNPGAPLRHTPFEPVLEIVIPRTDPTAALSLLGDEQLRKVLTVRNDVDWARGLCRGEQDRQVRERHNVERAGRFGAPRAARHPFPTPAEVAATRQPVKVAQ